MIFCFGVEIEFFIYSGPNNRSLSRQSPGSLAFFDMCSEHIWQDQEFPGHFSLNVKDDTHNPTIGLASWSLLFLL